MKKIILYFLIVLILPTCLIKRENPLDPTSHSIYTPNRVNGFEIIGEFVPSGNYYKSYNTTVSLQWNNNNDEIEGYYIYRSQVYDGLYNLKKTIAYPDSTWEDNENHGLEPENWYYYKISAFNEEGLEGYRSTWIRTWVVGG